MPALAAGVLVALGVGAGSGSAVAGVAPCQGQPATVVGTPAADDLTGTSGDDVIVGLGGSDTVRARVGDDVVCGGATMTAPAAAPAPTRPTSGSCAAASPSTCDATG